MVLEFDCRLYCDNLKETKPPYKCPLEECDKVYKTFQGIQYHLFNFHNNSARKPQRSGGINKRSHHRHLQNSVSFLESVRPPVQEVLSPRSPNGTNEQTVEINFDGKLQKINIHEALEVAMKEEDDDAIQSANSFPQQENSQAIESTKAPPVAKFQIIDRPVDLVDQTEQTLDVYYKYVVKSVEELEQDVEYLTDEEDYLWLEILNGHRQTQLLEPIKLETFELAMDRFEKAAFFYSRMHAEKADRSINEDAICSICLDGECQNSNAILFCDLCNLAVHQECYGVPYVPDGQWLCRRCLHSPSRVVECFLCPNRGGAFKQTVDGRWAHVVCAMWIPEVCFANAVFLEPIDGIENIPRARWRLTCYVCRQRHAGACIQCHRPNCYTAFHVTCAQHAGLHIRIAPVRETSTDGSSSLAVRKAAYCDIHAPQSATSQNVSSLQAGDSDDSRMANTSVAEMKVMSQDKMRHARSVLMEWRKIKPVISFPVISQDSLSSIAQKLNLKPNDDFLSRLKGYWMLKRQSRSGTSLLRRLQTNHVTKIKEQEKSNFDFDCSPDEYSKDVCSKISSEDASHMSANVTSRIVEDSQVLSGSRVEKIHANGRRVQSAMNNAKNRSLNKKLEDVDNMGYIKSSNVHSDNSMKIQIKKSRSRKQKIENDVELDSEKMMEIPENEKLLNTNLSEDLRANQVKKPRTIKRKLQDEDMVMEVEGQKPAKKRKLNKLSAAKMNKEDAVGEIKLNSVVDTDSSNMNEGDLKAGQERSNPFSKTVIDLSDFQTINSNIWSKTVDIWETALETSQPEKRRQTKRRRNGSLIPYDGKTVDKILLDTSLVVDTSIQGRRKNCSFASDEKDQTTFEGISIKTYLGRKKKGGIVPTIENKDVEGSRCALEDQECINAKTVAENIQTRKPEELFTQHKYWKRLRQDLERIRLLAELIRKREKLKLEQLQLQWDSIELQLKPFVTLLHKTLNQLEEKDTNKFFAEPVSNEEVPDYKEYIKNPMDFSTMRKKIDEHCYQTVADLAADFNLIIKNCMSYNGSHTIYYHAAYKLKRQAVGIIQAAKCAEAEVGYDPDTGLHLLDRPRPGEPEDDEGSSSFWNFLDGKTLENSSLEDQLRILLDRLNETTQAGHKGLNMHQQRRLKKEIVRVRRQMSALSGCSTMSPSSSKFNDSNITSASNDDTIGIPTTSFSIQPCSFITDTPSEASSTTLPVTTRHSAAPSKSVTVTRSKARLLDADLSTSLTAVSRKTRARKRLQLKKDSNDSLNSDEVGVGTSASDDQLLPPSEQLPLLTDQILPPSELLLPSTIQLLPSSEQLLPSTDQLRPSREQCLPPSEQQVDSLQIQSKSSEPCGYRQNVILSSCEQLSSCETSLPSNEQLLASNEQLLPTKEQLLPTNEQLLPTNEQLLPTNEQLLPTNEQLLPTNEQLLPTKEQLLPTNEQLLPTNEQLLPTNEQLLPTNEQLLPTKEQLLPTNEQLLPTNEQLLPTNEQLLPTKEQLLPTNEQLLPTNEQLLPTNEQLLPTKEQLLPTNEQLLPTNEQLLPTNEQLLPTNEQLLPTNEQLLPTNEQLLPTKEQLLPTNEQLLPTNEQLLPTNEQLLPTNEQLLPTNEQLLASNEQLLASSEQSLLTNEQLSASSVQQDDDQEQKLLFDEKQIVLKPSSELLLPSAEQQNNSSPSSDDRSDPSPSVDGKSDRSPSVDLYNDPVYNVDTVVCCNNGTNPVTHLDRVNPVVDSDQSPKSVNHSNQISVDHIDPAIAQLTVQDSGPTLAPVIEQESSSTLGDNLSSVLNEVATSSMFNLTVEAHRISESNTSDSAHEITKLTVATNEVETLAQNSCSGSKMQTAENVSRQQSTESVDEDITKTSEMLVAGGNHSVERSNCDVPQHAVKTIDSPLPENKACNGKIVVEFLRDSLGLSSEKLSTELKNRKQAVDILSQEKATIKNNNCKNNISLDIATLEGALKHSELESSLEITNSSCAVSRTGKQSTVCVGSIDDDSDDIEVLIQTTNVKCEDEDSSENSSNTFDLTENIPSPDAQCNEHCIEDFDSKLNLRCGSNCTEPSRLNGLQLIVHLRNEPDNRPPNQYVTQTSKDSEYAETIASTDSEVVILSDDETTKSSMVDAEITEATGNDLNGLVQSTKRHFPTIDAPVQ